MIAKQCPARLSAKRAIYTARRSASVFMSAVGRIIPALKTVSVIQTVGMRAVLWIVPISSVLICVAVKEVVLQMTTIASTTATATTNVNASKPKPSATTTANATNTASA